jgi:hypothetical protein
MWKMLLSRWLGLCTAFLHAVDLLCRLSLHAGYAVQRRYLCVPFSRLKARRLFLARSFTSTRTPKSLLLVGVECMICWVLTSNLQSILLEHRGWWREDCDSGLSSLRDFDLGFPPLRLRHYVVTTAVYFRAHIVKGVTCPCLCLPRNDLW